MCWKIYFAWNKHIEQFLAVFFFYVFIIHTGIYWLNVKSYTRQPLVDIHMNLFRVACPVPVWLLKWRGFFVLWGKVRNNEFWIIALAGSGTSAWVHITMSLTEISRQASCFETLSKLLATVVKCGQVDSRNFLGTVFYAVASLWSIHIPGTCKRYEQIISEPPEKCVCLEHGIATLVTYVFILFS